MDSAGQRKITSLRSDPVNNAVGTSSWMEAKGCRIDGLLVPGSLRPDAGEATVGGLWLVEAPNKTAIEQLLQTDPF